VSTTDLPRQIAGSRQSERGQKRVTALLRSAALVFGERGFEGATMTEIAARAESAIGSLYQFFPTKGDIASALSEQMTAEMIVRMDRIACETQSGGFDELAERLIAFFVTLHSHLPAYKALSEQPPHGSDQRRARIIKSVEKILSAAAPQTSARRLRTAAVTVLVLCKAASTIVDGMEEDDGDAVADLHDVVRDYMRRSL
jgi:AcrR family transcriptional regulator